MRAVRARRPDLPLAFVSSVPEAVVRSAAGEPITIRRATLDVGLVQRTALEVDEAGTARAAREFALEYPARVEEEVRWLREAGVRLVLADVPPLAFDAAAGAGIPSVALANFSWDWIYEHLSSREPGLAEAAEAARRAYGQARLLLELPFAGDLGAFPVREPIPLVARRPPHSRDEARRRLSLHGGAAVVLLSFGGIGLPGLRLDVLGALDAFVFLSTEGDGEAPPNVRRVAVRGLAAKGLDYLDLVSAADVVVTKPGYGIVSDAIAARTRIVYTERGDFPEYPILAREMPRWLPAVHIPNRDLAAGRLEAPLREVFALPFPEAPRLDGAEAAADRLLRLLDATAPSTPGRPSRTS
jgi:L-arabinokinase